MTHTFPYAARRSLRRTLLLLPVAVVLTPLVALSAPATAFAGPSPHPASPTATSSTCPVAAPTSAAGYQKLFDAKNDYGWSGADQADSLPLPDGRTLWLFGDTVQGVQGSAGDYGPGARMVHNSFMLQDRGCLTAVNGPTGAEVVPDASNGDWYWPQTALVEGSKLIVVSAREMRTGTGSLDFAGVGYEAALFTYAAGKPPVFTGMAPLPSTGVPEGQPEYGAALSNDGHYTYAYSSRKETGYLVFGKSVTVARVPVGSFLTLASWTYWNGSAWVADQSAAAQIVSAAPAGWSTTFSVLRRSDGSYRYVTKENDYLGSNVITGTAALPTGPFPSTTIASYPSSGSTVYYNPLAHPELKVNGGGLLITICRNSTDFTQVQAHADLYKPQFFTGPAL